MSSTDPFAARPLSRAERALEALAVLVVLAATLRFVLAHVGSLYDDAFIYFRYARVASEGCFYCFNADGPRVEGVTSPLYFLLVLGAHEAGARYFVAATAIGAIGVAGALSVAASTALRAPRDRLAGVGACMVLAAFAFDDHVQLNSVIGLETALAILLVTLVARSALLPAHPLLGALAFTSTLVRPEAALCVLLLPILPAMRSARRLAPPLVAMGVVVLVRLALFHDYVPNTYHAKAGGTWTHALLGARYLAELFRDEPLVLLAPVALLSPRMREGARYFLAVAAVWLAFCLRTGGDHFSYGRLLVPLVPGFLVLGVAGGGDVLAAWRRRAAPLALAAALVATIGFASVHRIPEQHMFANVRRWIHLGNALRAHYPGASLAVVPIGAIGYYSRAHVLDLVGLTEPAIARSGHAMPEAELTRIHLGHERHDTAWVLSQRPDLIVTTRYRERPWTSIDERRPGFVADRLLWTEIREGRAPYVVRDLEVEPGLHWLIYARTDSPRVSGGGAPASRGSRTR